MAEEICEALAAVGQPLATDIVSRGRGNDPPLRGRVRKGYVGHVGSHVTRVTSAVLA